MHCFITPEGLKTLASGVAELVEEGGCRLLICDTVASELRDVIKRDFPRSLLGFKIFLNHYGVTQLPRPERGSLEQARAVCVDPDDVPILAAAVQSEEMYGAMLHLPNDFETFHTPEMKAFLLEVGMLPVSLYGLLKVLGRR